MFNSLHPILIQTNKNMTRLEVIESIKSNSDLLMQLSYNKHNKTSYELRAKAAKTFVLVVYNGGEQGFEIYYPTTQNKTNAILDTFNAY